MRSLFRLFLIAAAVTLAAPAHAFAEDPARAKLQEYSTIVDKVGGEMFAATPESWDHGVLTIQSDGTRLTYQLKNEASPDKASLTPELIASIDELYVRMRNHGDTWVEARFEFRKVDGDVKLSSSFRYANE